MAIIVSGINHTTAPVELREKLHFDDELVKIVNYKLLQQSLLKEAVVVSTCNRTEIYGVIDDVSSLNGQIPRVISEIKLGGHRLPEHIFYHKIDQQAVYHLFRVAAGLSSMVVGEAQILGQVKQAFSLATEVGTTNLILNKLFHHAFLTGKRARTDTKIGEGAVSIASVAIDLARKIFGELSGKNVLLIGAGEMAVQTLTHLNDQGVQDIFIVNRTLQKAKDLSMNFGGKALPYRSLSQALSQADVVITSTAATKPILTVDTIKEIMVRRKNRPLFLIDVSVPRNIQPTVKEIYNTYLFNIDDLQSVVAQNLGVRKQEIPKVEQIVVEEVDKFMKWYDFLPSIQTIKRIQNHFEAIREREIKRNRKYFKQEDWEQMEKFSKSLMKKFLHSPIMRLKACPETGNLCERCTVREVFGMEDECLKSKS